ncbi:MAG: sugar-transfer associated ATP-grasp domain-containing protein [Cyanobium sp.]
MTPRPLAALEPVGAWLRGFGPRELGRLIRTADSPAPVTLLKALALLLWPGAGLTPAERWLYGLHRRRPKCEGAATAYIGEAPWAARCRRLNRRANRLLSDKLSLSYLLAGSRLGAPRTLAYMGVAAPLLPVPALASAGALVGYLRRAPYPLFLKPLKGSQGKGCLAIEGLDSGELLLGNGRRLPLAQATASLRQQLGRRAIVQERLLPHPWLQPVCGETCATVRLLSSCEGEQVEVLAAILKLPAAGAMVDNLHAANAMRPVALAPVEPGSGALGPWRRFDGQGSRPVEPPLALEAIPHWPDCLKIVHTLHPLDRGAVILGWDVAITATGPMLVEVNGTPGIDLWQLAHGRGFGDAEGRRRLQRLEARAWRLRHRSWQRTWRWLALRRPADRPGARRAG